MEDKTMQVLQVILNNELGPLEKQQRLLEIEGGSATDIVELWTKAEIEKQTAELERQMQERDQIETYYKTAIRVEELLQQQKDIERKFREQIRQELEKLKPKD